MNKAIVICYVGTALGPEAAFAIQDIIANNCDANSESITIKAFDSDSIAQVLLKKSAEDLKIPLTEDSDAKPAGTICITFNPEDCEQRLRTVKCIKESLSCSLKEAKDMFDCGKIYIPKSWGDRRIYDFIKGLNFCEVTVTDGMEDIAMIQAAIFLNETYSTKRIDLVRDFAAATYHSHTNSADEEEQALLTAVELVKNNPASATKWVSSELINVINSL